MDSFLHRLVELAASLVPGTRCVITLRRDRVLDITAEIDAMTVRSDGVEIPGHRLPPAEVVESSPPVQAGAATALGEPAPGEPVFARSADNGVSIPLVVNGVDIGSLRLFAESSRVFAEAEVERLKSFARQAAPALMLLFRQSAHVVLDDQLQEALATRAVIDQAMGVLMHARKISARQAFEVLSQASQTTNRKVSTIAAEVIEAMTGHPPEPPRPLTRRGTAFPPDPAGT